MSPRGLSRRRALGLLASAGASALAASLPACAPPGAVPGRNNGTLWFAYGGKNREVLLSLVDRFNGSQERHHLHAVYQGDYFESLAKLRTALAANAPPSLTHVVVEVVPYLVEADVLEPLTRFGALDAADLVPGLAQSGAYLGGDTRPLVALPFNRSTPIAYFNGTLLQELGLSPPTTWDELRAFAKAATTRDAGGAITRHGFSCPVDWWFWVALVGQAGGTVLEPDGTPSLGGEAGEKAVRLWQTLVHEDRTMKPPPGRDYNAWQVANTDFLAGRAAMIWTSTAFLRYLEDNAKFPVVAAPLPKDQRFAVPTGGTMFVMPKRARAEEQEAAFAFLQFMAEPAQANEFATKTGYLPTSKKGLATLEAEGFYAKHPNDRVAVDQLGSVTPWPFAPNLFRIQREIVQPRLESAVLERKDPKVLLDEARRLALID
jgi:sn-glycerol 3-phosphate transport system substrate-binding protein